MQREYGLDLRAILPDLSWRRFMVLLRGLSPGSATVAHLVQERYLGKRKDNVVEFQTPEAAQRGFEMLFKPPEGKA